MKEPINQDKLKTADHKHLEYYQIERYIKGDLGVLEAQLAGHHIMNCPRCETIWEKLIRQLNERPVARPSYIQTLRTLIL